jgi:hypothetical protein
MRLDLVDGANGYGFRYGDIGDEDADGNRRQQSANHQHRATPLAPSGSRSQSFQGPADRGRGNLRRLVERREDAQVGLVRERVFTLRPGSKKL